MRTDHRLRCSDEDREETIELLREHMTAGRLSMQEFDERASAALEAKTFGELAHLMDDLPSPVPPEPDLTLFQRMVDSRSNFAYISGWLSMSMVTSVLWALISWYDETLYWFWPLFIIAPWGALLLARALTATVRPPKRWYYGNKPWGGV